MKETTGIYQKIDMHSARLQGREGKNHLNVRNHIQNNHSTVIRGQYTVKVTKEAQVEIEYAWKLKIRKKLLRRVKTDTDVKNELFQA